MAGFDPVGAPPVGSILSAGGVFVAGTLPSILYISQVVSQTFTASGGTGPYTWTATGLPTGLSINSSTGIVSGTVGGSPQTWTGIVITATDSLSVVGHSFTLTVTTMVAPTTGLVRMRRQWTNSFWTKRKKPFKGRKVVHQYYQSINTASTRISWHGLEVPSFGNSQVWTSWHGLEAANPGAGVAFISWHGIEGANSGNGPAYVSWSGLEVISGVTLAPFIPPYKKRYPQWMFRKKKIKLRGRLRQRGVIVVVGEDVWVMAIWS